MTFRVIRKLEIQYKDTNGNFGPSWWLQLRAIPETQQQMWTGLGVEDVNFLVTKEFFDQTTEDSTFELTPVLKWAAPSRETETVTDPLEAARKVMQGY